MRLIVLLGGVFFAQMALCAPDADPQNGRRLARQCKTCHGIDGASTIPIAPHIGGESATYIARQLTRFRDGARVHEMMSVVASALSDADIRDLAAWYASIPVSASLPDAVANSGAPQKCVACHGADGLAVHPDAPNLAGESLVYIMTQLKAFRSGRRQHQAMNKIAAGLRDAEMRQAAQWFAAITFRVSR